MKAEEILKTYDAFLNRNDGESAGRYLINEVNAAVAAGDKSLELSLVNELIGHYRKAGDDGNCKKSIARALSLIGETGLKDGVSKGTIYLNVATGYKSVGDTASALKYYDLAEKLYAEYLPDGDVRLAGLLNNAAVSLAADGQTAKAKEYYLKAASISKEAGRKEDAAVSYVNLAHLQDGTGDAEGAEKSLDIAYDLLDEVCERSGYYAFVCEKCAPSYAYFGFFLREKELRRRAKGIYERA